MCTPTRGRARLDAGCWGADITGSAYFFPLKDETTQEELLVRWSPRANARMSLVSGTRLLKRAPHNATPRRFPYGRLRVAKKQERDFAVRACGFGAQGRRVELLRTVGAHARSH